MGYNCPPGSACYQAQKLANKYVPDSLPQLKNYLDCLPQYNTVFNIPCSAISACTSGDTNIANANLEFDGHHSSALNSWHFDIRNTMGDSTSMLFKIDASTGIQFGNGDGVGSTGYEFPLIRGSAGQVLQLVNTATTITTTPGELVWGNGNPTPITFITNSSFFRNDVSHSIFIGNKSGGFAGADALGWSAKVDETTLVAPSIDNNLINVAIPVPVNIYSGTTNALNICGHAYTNASPSLGETYTAITYSFGCNKTTTVIGLTELGRVVETFGINGVACFKLNVDAPPAGLRKGGDFIVVGFRLSAAGRFLHFSYRGSVENIQPN